MTDAEQLLRAIIESPADDGLRMIYADALDESGDAARADFVRVQVELAAIGPERQLVMGALRARRDGGGIRFWVSYADTPASFAALDALRPGQRIDVQGWAAGTGRSQDERRGRRHELSRAGRRGAGGQDPRRLVPRAGGRQRHATRRHTGGRVSR